jgi:hypothetical protein
LILFLIKNKTRQLAVSYLIQYCAWSGQAINASKSSIHFNKNTALSVIHSICDTFPFKRAMTSSKYLRLPLFFGKFKSAASSPSSSFFSSPFWKSNWKLNLNDRLRLFLWKIPWNILPTKERLGHLFPISNTHCPLCKVADDSFTHLFFECFYTRVVWHLSFWPLDSTAIHFSSMETWIAAIISPRHSLGIPLRDQHKFQIFASVACDILWFYMNKALHENLTFDARSMSIHINKISLEHF